LLVVMIRLQYDLLQLNRTPRFVNFQKLNINKKKLIIIKR
jgi:hypothetical protein